MSAWRQRIRTELDRLNSEINYKTTLIQEARATVDRLTTERTSLQAERAEMQSFLLTPEV